MTESVKGVSQHPNRDYIEQLWKDGLRAKQINEILEDEGLPVISSQTLSRYGQRYWSTSRFEVEGTDPEEVGRQIEAIRAAVGNVKKVSVRQSVTKTGTSYSHTIEVDPNVRTPELFKRVAPTTVKLSYKVKPKERKPDGWKVGVFLPDMQIGYWGDGSEKIPSHDEAAIDVAHQIMADVEAMYGLDLVVNAGDNLDLPALSVHRSAPGFMQTTRQSLQRAADEAAIQRALGPKSEIVWLAGNHEQRLTNYLVDHAPALLGLTRADEDVPILSIPYLCRFDENNVKFIDPYPDSEYWVNDNFRFEHGKVARSAKGATAANQLQSGVSTGYGHIHRFELLQMTRHTARGPRTHFAGSPGCLAKIDGAVPSSFNGITARGKQGRSKTADWQQGIWVFWWQPEGEKLVSIEPISIWGGWAMWRGTEYNSKVDENGVPRGRRKGIRT